MDDALPIDAVSLKAIPRARATRVSYNWMGKRYRVWIAEAAFFGWSIMTDYGNAGDECVVTSPRDRDGCIEALAKYVQNYSDPRWGHELTIDSWEVVSKNLDSWIDWQQSR